MSKLDLVSRVPGQYEKQTWTDIIRAICGQVNSLSEGRLAAKYNAQTTVPSGSVSYATGDFVPNSNCTVLGAVGAQYIVEGWVCVAPGTPGTFSEKRFMTGT